MIFCVEVLSSYILLGDKFVKDVIIYILFLFYLSLIYTVDIVVIILELRELGIRRVKLI